VKGIARLFVNYQKSGLSNFTRQAAFLLNKTWWFYKSPCFKTNN